MMALHWAMSFGNSRATPSLLVAGNRYGAFIFFAAICIISIVFAWFCVPETAGTLLLPVCATVHVADVHRTATEIAVGRSLEGMDKLFAVPLHKVHRYAYPTDEDLKPEMRGAVPESLDDGEKDKGTTRHQEMA